MPPPTVVVNVNAISGPRYVLLGGFDRRLRSDNLDSALERIGCVVEGFAMAPPCAQLDRNGGYCIVRVADSKAAGHLLDPTTSLSNYLPNVSVIPANLEVYKKVSHCRGNENAKILQQELKDLCRKHVAKVEKQKRVLTKENEFLQKQRPMISPDDNLEESIQNHQNGSSHHHHHNSDNRNSSSNSSSFRSSGDHKRPLSVSRSPPPPSPPFPKRSRQKSNSLSDDDVEPKEVVAILSSDEEADEDVKQITLHNVKPMRIYQLVRGQQVDAEGSAWMIEFGFTPLTPAPHVHYMMLVHNDDTIVIVDLKEDVTSFRYHVQRTPYVLVMDCKVRGCKLIQKQPHVDKRKPPPSFHPDLTLLNCAIAVGGKRYVQFKEDASIKKKYVLAMEFDKATAKALQRPLIEHFSKLCICHSIERDEAQQFIHGNHGSQKQEDGSETKVKSGARRATDAKVLSEEHGIRITVGDYGRLVPQHLGSCRSSEDAHLNDNLIDFFLKELENKCKEKHESVYVLPSGLYAKISVSSHSDAAERCAKSWIKSVRLFEHKFLLLPINEAKHWTLMVICNLKYISRPISSLPPHKLSCMLYLDSLGGPGKSQFRAVRRYLQARAEVENQPLMDFEELLPGVAPKVPLQKNSSDCGVYVIRFADLVLRVLPSLPRFPVTHFGSDFRCEPKDIIKLRKKMQDILRERAAKEERSLLRDYDLMWESKDHK